jgi:hypothetical protein
MQTVGFLIKTLHVYMPIVKRQFTEQVAYKKKGRLFDSRPSCSVEVTGYFL